MDDISIRTIIDGERKDFIDRFTAVGLSTVTRNIIINAVPKVKGDADKDLFASTNFQGKVQNTAAKIIQANFRDQMHLSPEEMKDDNFFGNAAIFLKKNAITEADYRFDRTLDQLENGKLDKDDKEIGMKIAEEFKSLGYTKPGLSDRVRETWRAMYAQEQGDIVEQVKDEVQGEIDNAQEKNKVVELAVSEIHDAADEEAASTGTDAFGDDSGDQPTDGNNDLGGTEDAPPAPTKPTGEDNGSGSGTDPETGLDGATVGDTTASGDGSVPAKEQTADDVAENEVPVSAASFEEKENTSTETLVLKFLAVGPEKISDAFKYRLKALKMAIESDRAYEALKPKFEKLESRVAEALVLSKDYSFHLTNLGLTPRGIFRKDDPIAVESAKQLVVRFIRKTGKIRLNATPPTNMMQAVESAFELVQLKRMRDDGLAVDRKLIQSREGMLFSSITDFAEGDKEKINAITTILGFKVENAFYPEFVQDTGMTIQERNVKDKAPTTKDDLIARIEKRFEIVFAKKVNDEDHEIIQAVVNGQEPYSGLSMLYEKLLIGTGKKALESSTFNAEDVERRARVYTTLVKTFEKFRIIGKDDKRALENYLFELSL